MLDDSRKKIIYKALAFTFAILFFAIIFASLLVNWQKSSIDKEYLDITNQTQNITLFIELYDNFVVDSNSCALMNKQLYKLADQVQTLNKQVGIYFSKNKGDADAKLLQKQFVNMNLELWLRMLNYNKICDKNRNYILYFYPYNCSECAPMADYIMQKKAKLQDKMWVYSIPAKIDSDIVDVLMNKFDVNIIPSIVVNGTTIRGPEAYKQIDKYLYK